MSDQEQARAKVQAAYAAYVTADLGAQLASTSDVAAWRAQRAQARQAWEAAVQEHDAHWPQEARP